VVSQIDLDRSEPPSAKGGKVLFISPWKIADSDLEALGFDYRIQKNSIVSHSGS
jgi:hypothetical protein